MGEKALVEGLIADSIELVRALDSGGAPLTFAAWYFYQDADEWRLLIAGPSFDELRRSNEALAYQKASEAISSADLQSLSIALVEIIESKSPLRRAIEPLVVTSSSGIVQAHFSDTTLNGIFLKEMIVLRSVKR